MEKEDVKHFKERLEAEKKDLETMLAQLGKKDPENPEHWETTPPRVDEGAHDKNEVADRFEDFEERRSTEESLERRLRQVEHALAKIEEGTYGICEVSGEEIPRARMEANPAATTLAEHAE